MISSARIVDIDEISDMNRIWCQHTVRKDNTLAQKSGLVLSRSYQMVGSFPATVNSTPDLVCSRWDSAGVHALPAVLCTP